MKTRLIAIGAMSGVVVLGCWWAWQVWSPAETTAAERTAPSAEPETIGTVSLTEEKQKIAGIQTEPVELRRLQETRFVPARMQYDDRRHVEIKAAADGVLTRVLVKPGDKVQPGQVLGELSTPEIGEARADVLKRQAECSIAERNFEWHRQINESVRELVDALSQRTPMENVQASFAKRTLGEYRSKLLTAYSRSRLAESLASSAESVEASGVVSSKTVRERLNEREAAQTELKAASELASFDARRESETAAALLEDAQRRLAISREHLTTLLGYEDAASPESTSASSRQSLLSIVESRAPFAGTIERRVFGATERVKQGDTMFVLADTSRLWIAADLREHEWSALKLVEGQELTVESPALPNRKLTARVYFLGPEVDPQSNAVPLVSEIDNADGQLRPGLFMRVGLPIGEPREVLAVPSAAVVEHEGVRFVFVAAGEGRFRRQDIRAGLMTNEWVEVLDGVTHGQAVVSAGAFILKSELLLEREE